MSRLQIGVKTKKNIKEYQATMFRTENISDHKEITLEGLISSSNYGEIDMKNLCESLLEDNRSQATPDLTPHIVSPSSIGIDQTKATFKILDLKSEPVMKKLFKERLNKSAVLSASNLKIIDYDEDKLTGLAVLFNKSLKTISVYKISFDCTRPS